MAVNTASSRRSIRSGLRVVQDAPHDLAFGECRLTARPPAIGLLELASPTKAHQPVALGNQLRTSQTQTHVVTPAQCGHAPDQLLFIASSAVQQDQERVGIIRLILPGDESCLYQRAGPCTRRTQRCVQPIEIHLWGTSGSDGAAWPRIKRHEPRLKFGSLRILPRRAYS